MGYLKVLDGLRLGKFSDGLVLKNTGMLGITRYWLNLCFKILGWFGTTVLC